MSKKEKAMFRNKEVNMKINLKVIFPVLTFIVTLTIGINALNLQEINPSCEKFLPVSVVEKMSGRQNVKLVPYNPAIGAGGTCNYAIDGKTMILLVNLDTSVGPQSFQRYKTDRMYQENQHEIQGLGEMAFSCGEDGNIVVALRGKTLVVLSAFRELDTKTFKFGNYYFTREQLIELAKQMLAKS